MKSTAKKTTAAVLRLPRARRSPAPRSPGLHLAQLVTPKDGGWEVRVGTEQGWAAIDASLDPELLNEAAQTGTRVLIEAEPSGTLRVVGTVCARRSLTIDTHGDVEARVRSLKVTAQEEVLLRTAGGFLQLKLGEAELYASRVAVRARELTRLLGRMIKLN